MGKRALLTSVSAVLLCLLLCLAPAGNKSTGAASNAPAQAPAQESSVAPGWAQPREAATAPPALAPAAPAAGLRPLSPSFSWSSAEAAFAPADQGQEESEYLSEEPAGGRPAAAAVPPPAPQNFSASYNPADGRVTAKWSAAPAPDLRYYVVHRWTQDDYYGLINIFTQLTIIDPTSAPYLESLQKKVEVMLDTPGLTLTERQTMLDDIETDLDVLHSILCSNPAASSLLSQLKSLADRYNVSGTSWTGATSSNQYHWYAVLARNRSGQESPFSHSEVIFSVRDDGRNPAAPKDLTATGYDPGVSLEWPRNTETDLAGYNLYRLQEGSWVKINPSLLAVGTEYFYEAGASGESYAVTAVDVAGRESRRTTATASLAPATVYQADDPGWSLSGTWKVENYQVGNEIKRILVANDAGATASFAFNGRRLKLMASTYHTCGQLRINIDGKPADTLDLYDPTIHWDVEVFTVTGLSKGSHVITLEALGTGGGQEPGEYHFVNLQYIEVR